ncbi:MAG: GNAT family N-acetyltransferase [Burkholderiales bacterium]
MLNLICHANAGDFLRADETFLLADEIANCVMLGSAIRMRDKPGKSDRGTYFASIMQDGKTVAAAMYAPDRPLNLTPMQPAMIELLTADLQQRNLAPRHLTADEATAREFADLWVPLNRVECIEDSGLRIYQLQKVIQPRPTSGRLRLGTNADAGLAAEWAAAFDVEVGFGDAQGIKEMVLIGLDEKRLYFWDDAGPVSMLLRNAPTPNAERVSVVYTPPECRGRGYGAAANAALAQLILDSGKRYACLFADINNPISNAMYLNIGYQPVRDVHRLEFRPAK